MRAAFFIPMNECLLVAVAHSKAAVPVSTHARTRFAGLVLQVGEIRRLTIER
jgi:hypothetical protein